MSARILNVAVILQMSFASHRDILFGISGYAKTHHWRLKLVTAPENFTVETLSALTAESVNGIITYGCGNPATAAYLTAADIPLVVIGSRENGLQRRHRRIAFVRHDDIAIGRMGARHLLSLGRFNAFGFVPENAPTPCSKLRIRGFRSVLSQRTEPVCVYSATPGTSDGSPDDISQLSAWLSSLPKPAAVMAVYDLRATHVLEAMRNTTVSVPSQLAVLGVDNDELLCDFSEPTLSSIAPNYTQAGEKAAQTLERMVRTRRRSKMTDVHCNEKKVVTRETTASLVPGTFIVNKAAALIRKSALDGITPRAIVRELGVSRRLAELRYRQLTGESMLTTLQNLRLSAVRRKLRDTRLPIATITAQCGFKSENYLKNLFKKRFGLSMRAFRQAPH